MTLDSPDAGFLLFGFLVLLFWIAYSLSRIAHALEERKPAVVVVNVTNSTEAA